MATTYPTYAISDAACFKRNPAQARKLYSPSTYAVCNAFICVAGFPSLLGIGDESSSAPGGRFGPGGTGSPELLFKDTWPAVYQTLTQTWTGAAGSGSITYTFSGYFFATPPPIVPSVYDSTYAPEFTQTIVGSPPAIPGTWVSITITDTLITVVYTSVTTGDSTYTAALSSPLSFSAQVAAGVSLINSMTIPAAGQVTNAYLVTSGATHTDADASAAGHVNCMVGACANAVPCDMRYSVRGNACLRPAFGTICDGWQAQTVPLVPDDGGYTIVPGTKCAIMFQKSTWVLNNGAPAPISVFPQNSCPHLNVYEHDYTGGFTGASPVADSAPYLSTTYTPGTTHTFNYSDPANANAELGFRVTEI